MLKALYNLGILMYGLAIRLAAPFSEKARKWQNGRKNWIRDWQRLQEVQQDVVWFHCASLGEFEMIRPLMTKIKADYPKTFLLTSFFSPSGFEQIKQDSLPDTVQYLPLDTPSNMKKLVEIFTPTLIIQVKNEFWLNWMEEVQQANIPTVLVAANITAEKSMMKGLFRELYLKKLSLCRHIFTQNSDSTDFLKNYLPTSKITTSQDTRFDRVKESRAHHQPMAEIELLAKDKFVWIGGSTYSKDEALILEAFEVFKDQLDLCLILAPHEMDHERMDKWVAKYPDVSVKYSTWDKKQKVQILWIDHIGMLSSLYHYADISFVGGGWGNGLHNILEAATFGSPIFFGPKYENFPEACDLVEKRTAFAYQNGEELMRFISLLVEDHQLRKEISRTNRLYIDQKGGASDQIYQYLLGERLLN